MLRASNLTAAGFAHGFSTRADLNPGSSAETQLGFSAALGVRPPPERAFTVTQVHGAEVKLLGGQDDPGAVAQLRADALVLCAPAREAAIAIRTADCVPLLLVDPQTRAVAAVHAGWRGLVVGVIGASVRALVEGYGALPERLSAALFPHIGPCCFEVGEDVAEQLAAAAPGVAVVRAVPGHKPHVDLAELACAQLAAAGVEHARIERVAGCTYCDSERFFSYRRDGQAAGRHWTAIVGA